jgi:uncharacterized protein
MTVFPRADHYLYTADPDPEIPLARQLAAGFLAMLTGWLAAT